MLDVLLEIVIRVICYPAGRAFIKVAIAFIKTVATDPEFRTRKPWTPLGYAAVYRT